MTDAPFVHVVVRGSKNGVGNSNAIGVDTPVLIRIFNSLIELMKIGWYFRIVHTFADSRDEITDSWKRAVDANTSLTHVVYIDGTHALHTFSVEDFTNAVHEKDPYVTADFVCAPLHVFCQTKSNDTDYDVLRYCAFDCKDNSTTEPKEAKEANHPKNEGDICVVLCDKSTNESIKRTKPKSKRRISSTASEPSLPLRRSSRLNPSIDA